MSKKMIGPLRHDDSYSLGDGLTPEAALHAALAAYDVRQQELWPAGSNLPEGEWDLFTRVLRDERGRVTHRAFIRRVW